MTLPGDLIAPVMTVNRTGEVVYSNLSGGMTKREYFAALALQGMLANEGGVARVYRGAKNNLNTGRHDLLAQESIEQLAMSAVAQADELIKELNKGANNGTKHD